MKYLPLKEFCKMYQPSTISTKEMIPNGEFPVYGANGQIGRYDKYNHKESQLLITCRGATCGSVNISEPFSWINGNAMVVQPSPEVATLEYMKYAFLGGIDVLSSITGSAQPQITRATLEIVKVPIPTIKEQEKIVEKLDSAFADIDLLEGNLELSDEKANQLLQSILGSAFTPADEGNLSANQGSFMNENYKLVRLGNLCDSISGLWTGKKPPFEKATVIRNTNFTKDCKLDLSNVAILDVETKQLQSRRLIQGDLIVEKSGGGPNQPVGRVVLFNESVGTYSLSNFTSALRVKNSSQVLPKYLQHFLYYQYVSGVTETMQSNSTGIRNLNIHKFLDIEVPLPSLDKQAEIVDKLDSTFAEIQSLKAQIRTKKDYAASLRQSLLSSAFTQEESVA